MTIFSYSLSSKSSSESVSSTSSELVSSESAILVNGSDVNINNNNICNILAPSQKSEYWNLQATALTEVMEKLCKLENNPYYIVPKEVINATIPESEKDKEFTVLDIAGGAGFLSIYGSNKYSNANFITTDFAEKYIEIANKLITNYLLESRIKALLMNGQNLVKIQNESIDYVFSVHGLIYFPNRMESLQEIHRVLKPNGKVAIATVSNDNYFNSVFGSATKKLLGDDFSQFKSVSECLSDPIKIENELKKAGFKNIEIKKFEYWAPALKSAPFSTIAKLSPVYYDHKIVLPFEKQHLLDELIDQESLINPYRVENDSTFKTKHSSYIGIGQK